VAEHSIKTFKRLSLLTFINLQLLVTVPLQSPIAYDFYSISMCVLCR